MTELEFEKACRGDQTAMADEYAWGSTSITEATTISGTEDGTETITDAGANANYINNAFTGGDAGNGPLRCGIFATATSTRAEAGAGYYGIMELSGSLWERSITIGNADGRTFTGDHGDGALETNGNATVALSWPSSGTASGVGFRGGSWYDIAAHLRVSDRINAAVTSSVRLYNFGFRCVRSSP